MTVSFSQIPQDYREPGTYAEIDPSLAQRGLQGMPHKTLIIGQKLAAGAAAAGELRQITDPEQAALAFGRGSMLHAMCVAYRRANKTTEMWAIALDDAAGAATAIKSITISKVVDADDFGAGTLALYIGGQRVQVGVTANDTPETVAAKIEAAANDPMLIAPRFILGGNLPPSPQVNFKARHAGHTVGQFDLRVNHRADEVLPTNMAVTFDVETAGATDPEIAPALLAADGDWWTEVVLPYTDATNVAAVDQFFRDRFDALDMRDGVAFGFVSGTFTEVFDAAQTRNSPFFCPMPAQNSPTPVYELAALYAGVAAHHLQIDPARQLKTLELPGALVPAIEDRFTPQEMNLLLHNGVGSIREDGGKFRLRRCVTSYRLSDGGALDTSYLDLNTMATLAFLRWSEVQRIELRFPRHKLANDGTRFSQGQAIVTPQIMRNELIALYAEWEAAGLVEDAQAFADLLIVERADGDPNRLNSLQTPDLINNFRIFAAKIQFRL